jgi:uncharacterized protein YbjT (DUF2867 family)
MILVTGATGAQGGATTRELLARGEPVRALVRDVNAPAAQALASAGATLTLGDLTDRDSLDAAMSGVDGVFSVQPAVPHEAEMGMAVADAAAAAGIDHLVYTSVAGVERSGPLSSWNTKLRIENHIRALGLPTTVLRPVKFMENLKSTLDIHNGHISDAWAPGRPCQVIAVDDIGWFAAAAFADPDTYAGGHWEIAGDELTHAQMAAAITTTMASPVTYIRASAEAFAEQHQVPVETVHRAMQLIENNLWQADIPALRRLHPGLMDFSTWLTRVGKAIFDAELANITS